MAGFVDEAVVFARGGRGGDGAASFHREKFRPKGGPDGGDGGRGGDVTFEVSRDVFDLAWLARHPHQRAEDGRRGRGSNRTGADGADRVIQVPDGTLVMEERGLVADLVGDEARAVVAQGGRGGRGNASLASVRNRLPRHAEPGEAGEEHRLELELRLVADVGLVGPPNAGKSTLLAAMTAARPKVADYPFTTITPNLGVAGGDGDRYLLADVPGLIEGAHAGKGLGDRFLRHVSRCRVLAFVVDLAGDDPAKDLRAVRTEVELHDAELAERSWIAVGTKSDLLDPGEADVQASRLHELGETMVVSGTTGAGVETLAARLRTLVEAAGPTTPRRRHVVLRPGRERFSIKQNGRRFRVEGASVERWVAETDLDDEEAVARLQQRLRREGVERRLKEIGARRGDDVLIGSQAFEFIPEDE